MNFGFNDEQEAFRETLRRFFQEKSPTAEVFRLMETAEGHDPAVWKQMAGELGLQGVHLPEDYGGQGFGFLELALAVEEMGRALVCAPYFSTVCLAANAILNAGDEDQKRRWLPGIAAGQSVATLALLDDGDRWDADAVAMEFTRDGDAFLLEGRKRLVTDGAAAGLVVVAGPDPAGGPR
jgi:alkylation response protein AidB-like acyl-CoA dehydrogenase